MAIITIQFDGMCCHIEPPNGSPAGVSRRSVLPHVHGHIPYIEVYTNDVDVSANPGFTFTQPYTRYNSSYRHIQVGNVKIELLNITSPSFTSLPSFEQRVPKLVSVEPRFTALRPALLQQTIPSGQVAAYFDITAGTLSSGPSEHFRTVFDPQQNWPVRHLGQWVQLDVEVSGNAPTLRVTDLANGSARNLVLKDGSDLITIGNQTLLDIHGQPGASGHFEHYYDLSNTAISEPRPKPKEGMGLAVGCSDTQWP